MSEDKIEKFFCNSCKTKTKHFLRAEYTKTDEDEDAPVSFTQRLLVIECCGCEHLALVKTTHFSENVDYEEHPYTGEMVQRPVWNESIYPPVTYRTPPSWFEDLPDPTLRAISEEIYKSLQTESHYLATFGSRTLIDRLIVLTVGDQGNFAKGLSALQTEGKISKHERDILAPVVEAGNAAAHRGWAPTKEQLATILDTVEGLIHRLLVLPKLSEELDEAVPTRGKQKTAPANEITTIKDKLNSASSELKGIYDDVSAHLNSLGKDVTVHPQKHYVAFRRRRNFASVQIYNQKRLLRIYLNIDPDTIELDNSYMRDVRQIGHFGTGDLEITIKSRKELETIASLIQASYEKS